MDRQSPHTKADIPAQDQVLTARPVAVPDPASIPQLSKEVS
jgi:hypothetical protein